MQDELLELTQNLPYPIEAFLFVQRGLDFTVRRIHGNPDEVDEMAMRHVTGEDLCFGLKDYAIHQYGLLARTVLKSWNIQSCDDFGQIVFSMVAADLMQQTEEDHIEDFFGVFDFAEAFSPELQLSENA